MGNSQTQARPRHTRPQSTRLTRQLQTMSRIHTGMAPAVDYSEEARKLWDKLGIEPSKISGGRYNTLDIIYRSSKGGGCIYVGNESAARDLNLPKSSGVTGVINCTDDIQNYHTGVLDYLIFNIAWWKRHIGQTDKEFTKFLVPLFQFIESKILKGENILIHCLAGAHRAGTTGIICLMYFGGLESSKATVTAKALRGIISPIGDFPQLLKRCDGIPRDSASGKFMVEGL